MEALNKELLESFESGGCAASFYLDGGSSRTGVLVRDKYGDVIAKGTGVTKNIALADAHENWSKPKAAPKKKTSKKKSAHKTAPIEADAPDADDDA
jgi:N-acetylglucosamine kinase-like BadF-type ATPase